LLLLATGKSVTYQNPGLTLNEEAPKALDPRRERQEPTIVGDAGEDSFVINDVALRIPPSQIAISKDSVNYEWNTLRTNSSMKTKSGHGKVEVVVNIIFEGADDRESRLIPLVAGLRATPFCTIYSSYLQKMLLTTNTNDDAFDVSGTYTQYKRFRPLAFALSGMSFSTCGHLGMPNAIQGSFVFQWFNYFPYTPLFAFKSGAKNDKPGYPWESPAWKAFYAPFKVKSGQLPKWPHEDGEDNSTRFWYREFEMIPKASALANRMAADLVNTLLRKPKEVLGVIGDVMSPGKDPSESKVSLSNQEILDIAYRKLVAKGLNINEELRKQINSAESKGITSATSGLVSETIKRLMERSGETGISSSASLLQGADGDNLRDAIGMLTKQAKTMQSLQDEGIVTDEGSLANGFKKVIDTEIIQKGTGSNATAGGVVILGRKRNLDIDPSSIIDGPKPIIEQIDVSFTNILAQIPLVAYRYPTFQHIGSVDANVTFVMNVPEETASELNAMYDKIETMSLRFKQIPAGYRTLFINNDFLNLLNLKEFVTYRINTVSIPDQPGRSRVTMTLQEAGLTSNSKEDENPEQLKQTFITGHEDLYKEVWKWIEVHLAIEGRKGYRNRQNEWYEIDWYKLQRQNSPQNKNKEAINALIDRARNNYNEWLKDVHSEVFRYKGVRSGYQYDTHGLPDDWSREEQYKAALHSLSEYNLYVSVGDTESNGGKLDFVPGLNKMLQSVDQRYKAYRKKFYRTSDLPPAVIKGTKYAKYKDKYAAERRVPDYKKAIETLNWQKKTGKLGKKPDKEAQSAVGVFKKRTSILTDMGLQTYLSAQRALIQELIDKWLFLDEPAFERFRKIKDSHGLSKGIMAYPDFRQQLSSLAGYAADKNGVVSETALFDYEPDSYLWYPLHDGGLGGTDANNFIDSSWITAARQMSIKSYESAQKNVDEYFSSKYVPLLTAGGESLALTTLKNQGDVSKLQPSITQGFSYYSTLVSEPKTTLKIVPDGSGKALGNSYGKKNPELKPYGVVKHGTDMSFLWDGDFMGKIHGSIPLDTTGHMQNNRPNSPSNPKYSSAEMKGVENLKTTWPREDSSQRPETKAGVDFYCPVASYASLTRKSNPCYVRDIGQSRAGWHYRQKAASRDWRTSNHLLVAAGCVDPAQIKKSKKDGGIGKSIRTATIDEYYQWKKENKGKRIGYVHKGVDVNTPVGTDVYALTDGVVLRSLYWDGAGRYIEINHPKGPVGHTRYLHLQEINPKIKAGYHVRAGECIAVSGRSGFHSMRHPHLHFECWDTQVKRGQSRHKVAKLAIPTNKEQVPISWNRMNADAFRKRKVSDKQKKKADRLSTQVYRNDVTSTLSSPIMLAVNEFSRDMLRGQGQGLIRAFPTFKLYFIEDDFGEKKRLSFDDFFSYNAVKSIRVVKSRKIAADLCVIQLTNISGTLSNRKYSQNKGSDKPLTAQGKAAVETPNPMEVGTRKENPIASLLLQEGMNISLRMGYSSDPDRLPTVFNGVIMGVSFSESDDLIELVAQSYAVELVQDIKGIEGPITHSVSGIFGWYGWGFGDDATTGKILENMMAQPEVIHFGRWTAASGGGTKNRGLLTNKWQFRPQPEDDNIFAPHPAHDLQELGDGWAWKDLKFTIYRTTIWDIFKEMELRHPNYIASPVPYKDEYGERMTMFFGLPNQLYFARSPNAEEQRAQDVLRNKIKEIENKHPITKRSSIGSMGVHGDFAGVARASAERVKNQHKSSVATQPLREQQLNEALKDGFIKPFRNYHLLTDGQHIVANNIQANSRGVSNTIAIEWLREFKLSSAVEAVGVGARGEGAKARKLLSSGKETYTLKLDNALPAEDLRTFLLPDVINCTNEGLAKRYALSLLCQNMKDIYKGDIIIIGNGKIKPYDVCYVVDRYTDMIGPVEVEQVTHLFDQEHGFLTEIKPDMLVQAAEWSLISSAEAVGMVIEQFTRDRLGGGNFVWPNLAWSAGVAGNLIGSIGGWLSQKIVNYTQLARPIIMAPLQYHGRPFAGGVPTRKIPSSSWTTALGNWKQDGDNVWNEWKEDTIDYVTNLFKTGTGQYSRGNFWQNSYTTDKVGGTNVPTR